MSIGFFRGLMVASAALLITACGSDNNSKKNNTIPVITLPAVAFSASENKEQCPSGGDVVESFADTNRNGVKDSNENTNKVYYCAGKLEFTQNYNDIVEVSEAPATLDPLADRTLSLTFTLAQRPKTKLSFDYSVVEASNNAAQLATEGDDFVATSGSVVFDRGETQKNINLIVKHDTEKEGHEIFLVKISNQVNTDLSDITIRINDDENSVIQFSKAESVLIESSSNSNTGQIVVNLSEALSSDITVPFIIKSEKVSDRFELADHNIDFQISNEAGVVFPIGATEKCNSQDVLEVLSPTKGCITFKTGETQKTINVSTIDDELAEGREKIDIQLQVVNALLNGENANHILSIVDAAKSIKAKFGSNCALSQDGTFRCWGNNTYGHMGLAAGLPLGTLPNTIKGNLAPITFKFDVGNKSVPKLQDYDLGFLHACALFDNAKIKCWGYNASGQLGNGTTKNAQDLSAVLKSVPLKDDAKSLALGVSHSCALLVNGKVTCWGANQAGQLGLENTSPVSGEFTSQASDSQLSSSKLKEIDLSVDDTGIKQLVTGANHNCVLFNSGNIACWGENKYGQLGLGDNLESKQNIGDEAQEMGKNLQRVDLGNAKTAKAITLGDRHTCALLNDDAIKCWGDNSFGQLGQGNTSTIGNKANQMGDALPAIELGDNFAVTELMSGGFHTCAIGVVNNAVDEPKVKCWGRNRYGQLGYEDTKNRGDSEGEMGSKLDVLAFATNRTVVSLALGQNHTCAILDNDQIKCWGVSDKGQLGMGNKESMSDGLVLNPDYDAKKTVEEDHPDGDCQSANRRIPISCDSVEAELGNPSLVTEVF